ncbi:AbiTii domain-containing protein [Mycobacterium colombiense]|uniref:AbiTii domain-containing protein n=1 Tax=Mycobacterium colombiense TaxID=339268 RepID=UPI00096DD6C9|nr:hypothetical protein [Mycobacterium colombiense]
MADADILKSLREQVLDESESLVGLLRKCLALGALTGSDELREWANNELKGYPDDAPLPSYRSITAPLFINQRGGNEFLTGQQINHLQIPKDLREYVPHSLAFRQPLEEIVQMAASGEKSMKMGYAIFSAVTAEWTKTLGPWQAVTALYYSVMPSSIAGIVSMIRTTLVEIVIDLAKDVPLDSLPSKAKVDSVVQVHIGSKDEYQVSVHTNQGVIGQGAGSTQIQNNSVPTELTALIAQMREALADIDDSDQRADAEQAVDDFDEAVSEDDPKPEKIKRRSRALERITTAMGSAVLTQATKDGIALAAEHFHLLT